MEKQIKINFTEGDLQEMLEAYSSNEEQTTVFNWTFDGIDVEITVGDDVDEDDE